MSKDFVDGYIDALCAVIDYAKRCINVSNTLPEQQGAMFVILRYAQKLMREAKEESETSDAE